MAKLNEKWIGLTAAQKFVSFIVASFAVVAGVYGASAVLGQWRDEWYGHPPWVNQLDYDRDQKFLLRAAGESYLDKLRAQRNQLLYLIATAESDLKKSGPDAGRLGQLRQWRLDLEVTEHRIQEWEGRLRR